MRVLHVIYSLKMGGAESLLIDLANQQVLEDKTAVLIINDQYDLFLIEKFNINITIFKINRKQKTKNPFDLLKFNFFVLKFRPHILHFHHASAISLLTIPFNKKYLTVHALGVNPANFNKFDKLFAISEAVKKDILNFGSFNVAVIPNGISTSLIAIKTQKCNNVFKIIQIGRFDNDIKGQDILVNALSILNLRYSFKFELTFIGSGNSEQAIKDLVIKNKIEKQVKFLGLKYRDYIYSNLSNFDLLVQPSRYEGFGLTIIEGMAAKVPVLVSNIEAPMDIIENGKFGSFFKVGDFEDCSIQIFEIFNNYSIVMEKAENAFNKVINSYSIKKMADLYKTEYLS